MAPSQNVAASDEHHDLLVAEAHPVEHGANVLAIALRVGQSSVRWTQTLLLFVAASGCKADIRSAHRLNGNVAGKDPQIGKRDGVAIFLLDALQFDIGDT